MREEDKIKCIMAAILYNNPESMGIIWSVNTAEKLYEQVLENALENVQSKQK